MTKMLSASELARLHEIDADGGKGFSGRWPHVTEQLIARKLLRKIDSTASFMLAGHDVEITDLGRGVLATGGMLEGNLKGPVRLLLVDEVDEWPPGFVLPSRQMQEAK